MARGNPGYTGWRKQWKRKRGKAKSPAKALTIPLKVSLGGLAGSREEHIHAAAGRLQEAQMALDKAIASPYCEGRVDHALMALKYAHASAEERVWSGIKDDRVSQIRATATDIIKQCTKR